MTQYLTDSGVRGAKARAGSAHVFTPVRQDFLTGQALYDAGPTYGRIPVTPIERSVAARKA